MSSNYIHTNKYEEILEIISEEFYPLIKDHYDLWKLMEKVRKEYNKALYKRALDQISKELNNHFQFEEEIILPKLKKHINSDEVGPVKKLIDEHETIRNKYQEIQQVIGHDGINENIADKVNMLAYLLKKHIEKEDHYFFPMISLILTNEEKKEIRNKIE